MRQILVTTVRFPEIQLKPQDAHKIRGYFGHIFKKHSELLHNHYETGELRYHYPLVQYKVSDKVPILVALEEGAELLTKLFLQIKKLDLEGRQFDIHSKNIENRRISIGYSRRLHEYRFQTLWMALNQENYQHYREASYKEKTTILEKILIGNILSFFKNMNLRLSADQILLSKVKVNEKNTMFKNQKMMVFEGEFVINAELPNYIGLGKAVSRGFGTIKKIN